MKLFKTLLFICVTSFSFFIFEAKAQQGVRNITQEIINGEVRIQFVLEGNLPGQTFEVILFAKDQRGFRQRLYFAKGDVGKNVEPGLDKQIIWKNDKEFTTFKIDDLTFEVVANMESSSLFFLQPRKGQVLRRGQETKIEWFGGDSSSNLEIDLYSYDKRVKAISNTSNKGAVVWRIPKKIKPGENYQLRIAVSNRPGKWVHSERFRIKRRIPLVVKIAPLAIIGGIVAVTLLNQEEPVTQDFSLPSPPGSPEGN